MGSSFCFYYFFLLRLLLHFVRTGDHKIPAHRFWSQVTWNIEIEVAKKRNNKKGGQHLAFKRGFWENFTRA